MNNQLSISDTKALFDYCVAKANHLRAQASKHNLVTESAKLKLQAAGFEQRAMKLEQILYANAQTLTFNEPVKPNGSSKMRKIK